MVTKEMLRTAHAEYENALRDRFMRGRGEHRTQAEMESVLAQSQRLISQPRKRRSVAGNIAWLMMNPIATQRATTTATPTPATAPAAPEAAHRRVDAKVYGLGASRSFRWDTAKRELIEV